MSGAPEQEVYREALARQLPRLVSQLDREPDSRSVGSFDRDYWGWKFRDFPVTMLQYGLLPLALAWRDGIGGEPETDAWRRSPRLLEWIIAAVEATAARQHRSGAFDSMAPNTFDHGVTLAMALVLCETVDVLGEACPAAVGARVCDVASAANRFASRSEEDYAFISNHQALFALAYLSIAARTGDPEARLRCDRVLERICAHQAADGWYREYSGADPGYETLGLFYLALVWERTGESDLLASLRRSAEFLSYWVHPDGSLGGSYGSRHTQLYFPGGLELLAPHSDAAAAVAAFMRPRLERGNVVTPVCVDSENLPTLLHAYWVALRACRDRCDVSPPLPSPSALPCQSLEGRRDFEEAGLHAWGEGRSYAVIGSAAGGVCRLFDRRSETLVYQDSGYLARSGSELWTSQRHGFGSRDGEGEGDTELAGALRCRARFAEVRQELPSPLRFVALRLLNLTLFRSRVLGAWLRRQIIERLITAAPEAPLQLVRSFVLADGRLDVIDRLSGDGARIDSLSLVRTYTSIHMGSARYFHPAELLESPLPAAGTLSGDLRRKGHVERRFSILFSGVDGVRVEEEMGPSAAAPAAQGDLR